MSLENAKHNLKAFGKELNLNDLEFDEHNTCILGIDNEFSIHITAYIKPDDETEDYLYVYAPLLDGLPKDDKTRLKLYERLLEASMLGGQVAGGGLGVAVKEELILMHIKIPMQYAGENELKKRAPAFVERVEALRKECKDIVEGREVKPSSPTDKPIPTQNIPGQAGPGQGYIKI